MRTLIGNGNIRNVPASLYNSLFLRSLAAPTTLQSDFIKDTYDADIADTTGFADTTDVVLTDNINLPYFGTQTGAAVGNVISLDTPAYRTFPLGTPVIPFSRNMAIDGTAGAGGREIFTAGTIPNGKRVEITRITGAMTDNLEPDDSRFGGTARLAKGAHARKVCANGDIIPYFNWCCNGDIILATQNGIIYNQKAGGGAFGVYFSIGISGAENRGSPVQLNGGDRIEILIQDDLRALLTFVMILHGKYVID